MQKIIIPVFCLFIISFTPANKINKDNISTIRDSIPLIMQGNFKDDYDISYSINDSLWIQHPGIKYHIIEWNIKEKYVIARNDDENPGEPGLYTRIDYMEFENMQPFLWGFCLTDYNAKTGAAAKMHEPADRQHPLKGCGGYPFSRMKKAN